MIPQFKNSKKPTLFQAGCESADEPSRRLGEKSKKQVLVLESKIGFSQP